MQNTHRDNTAWLSWIYPRNRGWFNIRKSINEIHYINRICEKKNYMTISLDAVNASDKIEPSFMIFKKFPRWLRKKGNFLKWQRISTVNLQQTLYLTVKFKAFLFRLRISHIACCDYCRSTLYYQYNRARIMK